MTPTITESNVMATLRGFLLGLGLTGSPSAPGGAATTVAVQQSQMNRVAEPGVPDYVLMTPLSMARLATNVASYAPPTAPAPATGTRTTVQPTQVTVQLDVHGPASADNVEVISTLFRDTYACDFFSASGLDLAPLYSGDPRQSPFINAEQQYENRWTLDAVMQSNAAIVIPQDFAASLVIGVIDADEAYPPGPTENWGGFAWDDGTVWGGQIVQAAPMPTPGAQWVLPNGPLLNWSAGRWDSGVVWK